MKPLPIALLATLLVLSPAPAAVAQSGAAASKEAIHFIGVLQDKETALADERLARFLEDHITPDDRAQRSRVKFDKQTMPYGAVIRKFADWKESDKAGSYVARITPYAYVAAEMLGAQFDILAIYKSAATTSTTYHSYFVVNKELFDERRHARSEPTLDELEKFLKSVNDSGKRARFIYHDRFSTSSYFLPSLYFRGRHIFAMTQAIREDLIPIQVEKLAAGSSSALVEEVAGGNAALAAVWDGTKKKFEKEKPGSPSNARYNEYGQYVYFIPLPTSLPNDLLVCARWLDKDVRARIVVAIKTNPAAGRDPDGRRAKKDPDPDKFPDAYKDEYKDDYWSWLDITTVPDPTLEALAKLRQDARERPAAVTVKIVEGSAREGKVVLEQDSKIKDYLEAAKQGVRLSGTEFVLFDPDLHKRVDVTWWLKSTHDGALTLTPTMEGFPDLNPEEWQVSFVDKTDLPKRIADLVRTRMRRIRYVWPYEEKYPAVLRDLDFNPDKEHVMVQRITWTDPETHEYDEDIPFKATIASIDFNKLQLSNATEFPKDADGSFSFEPMSNVAYRVVLAREPRPGWIWMALPYVFIGVFVLAWAGFALDLRRRRPEPTDFQQTYRAMVEKYHGPWREHEIDDRDLLWCDPAAMDELVKQLRMEGRFMNLVRAGSFDFSIGPIPIKLSLLLKIVEGVFQSGRRLPTELMEVSAAGRVAALDNLIHFLVGKRRLSPFIGFPEQPVGGDKPPEKPTEWEALNSIVSRHFHDLGIFPKQVDANVRRDSQGLSAEVSSHFDEVIRKGMRDASFFRQTWRVQKNGGPHGLIHSEDLDDDLPLAAQHGSVAKVVMKINMPATPPLSLNGDREVDAWVLGKIVDRSSGDRNGTLALQLKPIAIVKAMTAAL